MKACKDELQERLHFIDRTINHAVCACRDCASVPHELRQCVDQMEHRARQARRALQTRDVRGMRETVDALARLSHRAQGKIHFSDGMAYAVKSAVILAHIEVAALRWQLG
ncbi:hypothetical protein E4K72_13585 [Oxalobacteraceae bacterium OM1]|nr:hypothetical protein E4K72_13585 [Oxalobacteraceae bacterium OM1]